MIAVTVLASCVMELLRNVDTMTSVERLFAHDTAQMAL